MIGHVTLRSSRSSVCTPASGSCRARAVGEQLEDRPFRYNNGRPLFTQTVTRALFRLGLDQLGSAGLTRSKYEGRERGHRPVDSAHIGCRGVGSRQVHRRSHGCGSTGCPLHRIGRHSPRPQLDGNPHFGVAPHCDRTCRWRDLGDRWELSESPRSGLGAGNDGGVGGSFQIGGNGTGTLAVISASRYPAGIVAWQSRAHLQMDRSRSSHQMGVEHI